MEDKDEKIWHSEDGQADGQEGCPGEEDAIVGSLTGHSYNKVP